MSKHSRFDNDHSEIDNFDVDFNNEGYFWAQPP